MSVDYSTYVGPFILCKTHTEYGIKKYKGCPLCQKAIEGSFCSKCGSKAVDLETTVEKMAVKPWDILDEDVFSIYYGGDMGESENTWFLFPNVTKLFGRKTHIYHRRETGVLLTEDNVNIEAEIQEVESMYAKELDKLLEVFDKVEVHWGIVTTAN